MSWTTDDLDMIRNAIRNIVTGGAHKLEYPSGKGIEMLSLQELRALEKDIIEEVAATDGRSSYSLGRFVNV